MDKWGIDKPENGVKRPALIVSSFHGDRSMEIANVVYVGPDEILYPVPRSLYVLPLVQREYMSNSQRNKMTTILPDESLVYVQIDPNTSVVNCMYKGGTGFGLVKRVMDWVMEVDVAVSDEQYRQVFVTSSEFSTGILVETKINLKNFKPNKPYKGIVKLNICYDSVADSAMKGIKNFVSWQKILKEADRSFFDFTLTSIYDTDEPNISVVYDAPWQTEKRSIVLTPAQVGDVSEDEWSSFPSYEPKQGQVAIVQNFLYDQQSQQGKDEVGTSVPSVVSNDDSEKDKRQQENFVGLRSTDDSLKPISECISTKSFNQIMKIIDGVTGNK